MIVSWLLDLAARALIESPEMLFTLRHEDGGYQERAAVAAGVG